MFVPNFMESNTREMGRRKKLIMIVLRVVFCLVTLLVLFVLASNVCMIQNGKKCIISDSELKEKEADCILILGAGVWGKNPSPILRDRLDEGLRLYKAGIAPKIIVSGDHGKENYDEVNVMKNYLMEAGVPDEDIFMDHAGFSTYESMYRAKAVFGVDKMIIVTQQYHIYRSIYIAKKLGIEAYGSPAECVDYSGNRARDIREIAARTKDVIWCTLKIKPKYLGEKIDLNGSGTVTND